MGIQLAKTCGSSGAFLSSGSITATFKDCGKYPVKRDKLIMSSSEVLIKGKTSLSNIVGIGSNRHIDALD